MNKKNLQENGKKTFKDRIVECIGDEKPYSWGKSIGLDDGIVTRIFKQNKIPRAEHLLLISKGLGKSINWLLSGEEHPLDKKDLTINRCVGDCNPEEQHTVFKLIEIFRHDYVMHKFLLTDVINHLCGDKQWIQEGKPERRKKPNGRPGMYERRKKLFLYKD